MKSALAPLLNRPSSASGSITLSFQNKYAKAREREVSYQNQKLIGSIGRIKSVGGSYNPRRIESAQYRAPQSNKKFHDNLRQSQLHQSNLKMLNKLKRTKSHYSVQAWNKEAAFNTKLAQNLSQNARVRNPFVTNRPPVN